jgi:sporulation protein YlmC with PRC-barrel domain
MALAVPAFSISAGSALAQSSDQDARENARNTGAYEQRSEQSDMARTQRAEHRGYLKSMPTNGTQASLLMGQDVMTRQGENMGAVSDLVIDKDGQVIAIVVGVGGILGMGEKDVAIGWDDLVHKGNHSTTDNSGKLTLQSAATADDLRAAPEFKTEK